MVIYIMSNSPLKTVYMDHPVYTVAGQTKGKSTIFGLNTKAPKYCTDNLSGNVNLNCDEATLLQYILEALNNIPNSPPNSQQRQTNNSASYIDAKINMIKGSYDDFVGAYNAIKQKHKNIFDSVTTIPLNIDAGDKTIAAIHQVIAALYKKINEEIKKLILDNADNDDDIYDNLIDDKSSSTIVTKKITDKNDIIFLKNISKIVFSYELLIQCYTYKKKYTGSRTDLFDVEKYINMAYKVGQNIIIINDLVPLNPNLVTVEIMDFVEISDKINNIYGIVRKLLKSIRRTCIIDIRLNINSNNSKKSSELYNALLGLAIKLSGKDFGRKDFGRKDVNICVIGKSSSCADFIKINKNFIQHNLYFIYGRPFDKNVINTLNYSTTLGKIGNALTFKK